MSEPLFGPPFECSIKSLCSSFQHIERYIMVAGELNVLAPELLDYGSCRLRMVGITAIPPAADTISTPLL